MSFGDNAILWLHIAAAVFTIGPGTAAIMSTPRYIRKRNPVIVGYLLRTTRIYSFGTLLVLVFGLILDRDDAQVQPVVDLCVADPVRRRLRAAADHHARPAQGPRGARHRGGGGGGGRDAKTASVTEAAGDGGRRGGAARR